MGNEADLYRGLREKLDSHPAAAPDRPEILEILHILFTPEEASVAIHLAFTLKPVEDIAHKTGLSVADVTDICERLADKGLILSRTRDGKKFYGLLPLMPGIFEFPFMKTKYLDFDFDRLARLWHQYYEAGWGREFHSGKTSMSRIIPVRRAITSTSTVLPFEEVANYINKAECISLGNCACRVAEKKCNNPIEVCLGFDSIARFLVERKMARFITKQEAFNILEVAEKAGLVHLTSNTADRIGFICNCCPCCCVALAVATRVKDASSHPISNFHALVNGEKCNLCAACEDRCPAKAIKMDDVAVVNVSLCIGCGLCVSVCATEAISLVRRADSTEPPAEARELALKAAQERGRLETFLANLT